MRELTRRALDGQGVSASSLRGVVDTMLGGAVETVRDAIPAKRESTLREVVRGVAEGADAAMEAGKRGASNAARQARAVGDAARPLQESVVRSGHDAFDAMMEFSKSLAGSMREQVASIVDETRRATREMRPAAARIGRAVSEDPAALAKDSVEAAARIAAGGASQFISTAGGMLSGIGAALEERLEESRRPKKAKRS